MWFTVFIFSARTANAYYKLCYHLWPVYPDFNPVAAARLEPKLPASYATKIGSAIRWALSVLRDRSLDEVAILRMVSSHPFLQAVIVPRNFSTSLMPTRVVATLAECRRVIRACHDFVYDLTISEPVRLRYLRIGIMWSTGLRHMDIMNMRVLDIRQCTPCTLHCCFVSRKDRQVASVTNHCVVFVMSSDMLLFPAIVAAWQAARASGRYGAFHCLPHHDAAGYQCSPADLSSEYQQTVDLQAEVLSRYCGAALHPGTHTARRSVISLTPPELHTIHARSLGLHMSTYQSTYYKHAYNNSGRFHDWLNTDIPASVRPVAPLAESVFADTSDDSDVLPMPLPVSDLSVSDAPEVTFCRPATPGIRAVAPSEPSVESLVPVAAPRRVRMLACLPFVPLPIPGLVVWSMAFLRNGTAKCPQMTIVCSLSLLCTFLALNLSIFYDFCFINFVTPFT